MHWIKAFAAAALLTLGISGRANADAFDPHTVPADAKWVLHVDMDTARDTKLWDAVEHRLMNDDKAQAGIAQLETITGLRFPQDFHDVTLYGRSATEEAGVIICHADADADRIITALKMNPDYGSSTYGSYEIHSWADKGKTMYGAFHGKSVAIIGHSEENIKAALDTLDAKTGALQANSPLAKGAGSGLVAYVAGEDLTALRQGNREQPPFIPLIDSAWVSLSEDGDHVLVKANVLAKTATAADQMRSILEGAKAMLTLTAGNENSDPNAKMAAAALANLTSKVQDKTVSAELPISLDLVRTVVEQAGKKTQATTEPAK